MVDVLDLLKLKPFLEASFHHINFVYVLNNKLLIFKENSSFLTRHVGMHLNINVQSTILKIFINSKSVCCLSRCLPFYQGICTPRLADFCPALPRSGQLLPGMRDCFSRGKERTACLIMPFVANFLSLASH